MRRFLAIAVLLAAVVAAIALTGAGGSSATGTQYKVVFDNGFGLVKGGELKIGGVTAGETTDFNLTKTTPKKVIVTVKVTKPGFANFRTDASCRVRQQSLIGEYFVDCQPGKGKTLLGDNGTVPVKQTASTIPPDLIANVSRRPYRERFRLILSELGTGLAGRPAELNEVIRRAHPALRETTQTLNILARQNKIIKDFIRDADTVSEAVEPRKLDLARWAKEASETASIQATRTANLSQQYQRLPRFLAELEPTAAQLEQTATQQIPLLRKLRAAAPDLDRFFTTIGPFSDASQTSVRSLGKTAVAGKRAIDESKEEVAQLRELSKDAPKLGKPLRQFLQTIDDRGRSTDDDPLAAKTSPPAPDKTAYKQGQGFTGMEALWNYFYYQTLATNVFDEVGKLLRASLIQSVTCSPYVAKPTEAQRKTCGSLLGPYQPGVTVPDPTEGGVSAREARERRSSTSKTRERRRGAGEPEAPVTPGQRDISKPQIALPPEVQQLLDRLPKAPGAPTVPNVPDGASSTEVLDFLLGP